MAAADPARHGGLELHLVGPLQSNKAKEAVALFDAIHSVDRASLAEALAKEIARQGRAPLLFVEINTGAEPQKAGVLPQDADALSRRLPRPLRADDCRPDVHPARRRGAGAAFRADRQDRPPQRAGTAVDGHERRFPDRDRVRRHPRAGRHRDFRRRAALSASKTESMIRVFALIRLEQASCRSRWPQRDAAGGRREARPGHMEEDGAAAAGHPRPGVVVDLDDDVVEAVVAPEPVAWFIGRAPERPVVAPVVRVLAPGIVRADAADRQQRPRPRQAVGPPPQPQRAKSAARGAAVAFALVGLDAGAAERDRHAPRGRRTASPAIAGPAGR